MPTDRIIAEVRQAREELARRCNYDLHALIQDARNRQAVGGRKVVSFPPKPVRKTTGTTRLPNQPLQPAWPARS